jgi:hypothetical protein
VQIKFETRGLTFTPEYFVSTFAVRTSKYHKVYKFNFAFVVLFCNLVSHMQGTVGTVGVREQGAGCCGRYRELEEG